MNIDNGMVQNRSRALYFHLIILIGWCFCSIGMASINSNQILEGDTPKGLNQSEWNNIQAQIAAKQYKSHAHEQGGFGASNNSHNWKIHYQKTGTTSLTPKNGGDYKIDLKLNAFGYQQLTPMAQPIDITHQDNEVTYQWNAELKEVWTNSNQSLEQWFILEKRPKINLENSQLKFELTLTTDLNISQQADGLHFSNTQGIDISYNKLKVWDKDGTILPSKMLLANNTITLQIDDSKANYPLTIDPIFQQQAYLKASNTGVLDNFGYSVAVSGDTLVVGAIGEASSTMGVDSTPDELAIDAGAAYVFFRNGTGVWVQQAYLKASNTEAGDLFGVSVAVSGDTVVVGASDEDGAVGAAYVFIRDGFGVWAEHAYLKASNTGVGDEFGLSVAVSGDTVVVGAWFEDSSSVGVDSTPNDPNSFYNSGAVYVFTRDTATDLWSQQSYIKAFNTGNRDFFGRSVAISGNTVVVGAHEEDGPESSAGAVYVFIRDVLGVWTQQAYLKASNTTFNQQFGWSVAVSDDTLVVGAPRGSNTAGEAFIFVRGGDNVWAEQAYLQAHNPNIFSYFGCSVAVSGDMVVVGSYGENSSTTGVNSTPDGLATDAGAAYVFIPDGAGTWIQQAYLKASNAESLDNFGNSVAVSGDTILVGAVFENSLTTGVNSPPNNSGFDSGAAYVFNVVSSDIIFEDGFETATLKVKTW